MTKPPTPREILHRFDARQSFFEQIPDGARVLELGCGSGGNLRTVAGLHAAVELHGVDLARDEALPESVAYADVDLDEGRLPFPDDHFDRIVFVHVIEHLSRPLGIAPEIRRVLTPGGLVYAETPNWTAALVPSFGFRREQHQPFNFYDDPTHVHPWSRHGLYEFLGHVAGLEVVGVGAVRNWFRTPLNLRDIAAGVANRDRGRVIGAVHNLVAWSIYAIGRRPVSREEA